MLLNKIFKKDRESVKSKIINQIYKENKNSNLLKVIDENDFKDVLSVSLDTKFANEGFRNLTKMLESLYIAGCSDENKFQSYEYILPISSKFCNYWVKLNGYIRSTDEACELIANKWCQMIFNWHLHDNGNLDNPESFKMSAVCNVMAEEERKKISPEMQEKCRKILAESYKAVLRNDRKWLIDNLAKTDNDVRFFKECQPIMQEHFGTDYGPDVPMGIILRASGLEDDTLNLICPWKTHLYIDVFDNSIVYSTEKAYIQF